MAIGVTIFIIAILIITIWVVIEVKRMRHKIFALFLIGLILFSYISFSVVFKNKEVNITSIDGIKKATTMYLSWLGGVFSNLKTVTTNAVHLNWKGNETG